MVINHGTARMPVDVALTAGERFEENGDASDGYREVRQRIELGASESRQVTLRSDFEPDTLLVDPDVVLLQLHRDQAAHHF